MEQQSILGAINKFTPGPGKYDSHSTLSNVRYTLRQKTDAGVLVSKMKTPGPGQYNAVPALTEKGDHFVSKFRSSGASVINPVSKRFQDDYSNASPTYPIQPPPCPAPTNTTSTWASRETASTTSPASTAACAAASHTSLETLPASSPNSKLPGLANINCLPSSDTTRPPKDSRAWRACPRNELEIKRKLDY